LLPQDALAVYGYAYGFCAVRVPPHVGVKG
jgi:hypothetical protein